MATIVTCEIEMMITECGSQKLQSLISIYIYSSLSAGVKNSLLHRTMANLHRQLKQPQFDFKQPEIITLSRIGFAEIDRCINRPWFNFNLTEDVYEYYKYLKKEYYDD